jgi:hypothetical protein
MPVSYHVAEHDGGFGYRVGDVWSETFPDHDSALAAAQSAAERQQLEGDDAEISYQRADGSWQTEHVGGGDRPPTEVIDDQEEHDPEPQDEATEVLKSEDR